MAKKKKKSKKRSRPEGEEECCSFSSSSGSVTTNTAATPTTNVSSTSITIRPENSFSVAGRPLPPAFPSSDTDNDKNSSNTGSIVLFYQYKELMWTESEFQKVLKVFLQLANKYNIKGRGRIAPEGVNCTLSSSSTYNCHHKGQSQQNNNIRDFCHALRGEEWANFFFDNNKNSTSTSSSTATLFHDTDFKITDNVPQSQLFKSLNIRKVDELVAYGMAGNDKAPSLAKFGGHHLTALEYHRALQDPNTVVIDVRNQYETAIGTIRPPPGGATLMDPKMRNSHEWPKWLASKQTQEVLHNKTVLTFCTGGIRCERATALINQMSAVTTTSSSSPSSTVAEASSSTTPSPSSSSTSSFQPKGVYHMRGGIERYLKTFPDGGYWNGKNYLFDKRMEQLPEGKQVDQVEQEVRQVEGAKCCHCRQPWTTYRGKFKCQQPDCGVPVLVCDSCAIRFSGNNKLNHGKTTKTSKQQQPLEVNTAKLQCELCREGYRAPQQVPDLVALKKKAEKHLAVQQQHQENPNGRSSDGTPFAKKAKIERDATTSDAPPPPRKRSPDRLFLSRLPLTVRKTQIEEWLKTSIENIQWLVDKTTGAFYGSCIVQVDASVVAKFLKGSDGKGVLASSSLGPFPGSTSGGGGKKKKSSIKKLPKISPAMINDKEEVWPPKGSQQTEFPPIGFNN